jgi:hypothetical protein
MKYRILLFFSTLLVCLSITAQVPSAVSSYDTLTIQYRTGGGIDSVDQIVQSNISLLPGGGWHKNTSPFFFDFFSNESNGRRFFDIPSYKKMRFSGLPHIGFSYVFGSSGLQQSLLNYQQTFKHGLLINLDVVRFQSSGLLRNGSFLHNDVHFQLEKNQSRYRLKIQSSYLSSNVDNSDGLLNTFDATEFDLLFLSVRKSNAETRTRRGEGTMTHYFDLLSDSTRSFFLYVHQGLRIKNWKYFETSDTLSSMYGLIRYDSTSTQDQFQWSSVVNAFGADIPFKKGNINVGCYADYWQVQNLGKIRDTTELSAQLRFNYNHSTWSLNGQSAYTLLGSDGEHRHDLNMSGKWSRFTVNGRVYFSSLWPDEMIRFAQGNNYQMDLVSPQKQQTFLATAGVQSDVLGIDYRIGFSTGMYWKHYFFDGLQWRNDLLEKYVIHSMELELSKRWKGLTLSPRYLFSVPDQQIQMVPMHQFTTRISLQGGIFRAKKLRAAIGMDVSWVSSYERMGFFPLVAALDLTAPIGYNGFTNLHFFGAIHIDEFKFFARVENVGVIWTERSLLLYEGYPIVPLQINVGITWDFFN